MRNREAILICLIAAAAFVANAKTPIERKTLDGVISKAQQNAWGELKNDTWCFPSYLGTWFMSEYYFEIQALGFHHSQFNETFFTQLLLDTQLPDGSWEQVREHNLKTGGLDPTIFNYWYLKTVGIDEESPLMVKSKLWILENGGIEGAQTMSKFKLAVFGQYPWTSLASVPLFIFQKGGIYSYTYMKDIVAQWVYPHLTALSYLRHHQSVFRQGADIRELWLQEPAYIAVDEVQTSKEPSADVLNLVHEMLSLRQKLGSFGGYTIATLLNLLALKDF